MNVRPLLGGSERKRGVVIDNSASWSFGEDLARLLRASVRREARGSHRGYERREGRSGFSLRVLVVGNLFVADAGRVGEEVRSRLLL